MKKGNIYSNLIGSFIDYFRERNKQKTFKYHLGVGWYKFTHIVEYVHALTDD